MVKLQLLLNCVCIFVRLVSADYQFELQLLRYQNPSHRLGPTERCCDSDEGLITCIDPCDNTLHLCLSRPGQSDCSLGQLSTGPLHVSTPQESDRITFSTGGGFIAEGIQNPLIFTGYEWPGGFELVVTVSDKDGGGVVEVVDGLVVSRPTAIRPRTTFTPAEEIRGYWGRGFLRLSYRLICTGNYAGDTCTTNLCTNQQCTDSEVVDVCSVASPCENAGVCSPAPHTEAGYVCSCPPQFEGSRCEIETSSQPPPSHTPPSQPPPSHTPPSQPSTPTESIVLVPTPVVGSDQEGVLVSVVVSCVLLTVTGLLLLVLGVVFLLLRRQRSAEQTRLRKVTSKSVADEGMYDNPTYISGGVCTGQQADAVPGGGQEVVYQLPHTTAKGREAGYQPPVLLDAGAGVEEAVYRKLINPLYYSQSPSMSHEQRFQSPIPRYSNDPSYATPSFCGPHSHTDMACQPEPFGDNCSHNYEPVENI